MKKNKDLRFSLKDFIIDGRLGEIKLGSQRKLVENCLGKIDFEDILAVGSRHTRYVDLNLSFDYWIKNDEIFNINLYNDIKMFEINKTEDILKNLFDDYMLFYKPATEIFKLIFESKKKLYFVRELSDDISEYYYVTSDNVKLLFNPFIGNFLEGAQLSNVGVDIGCLNQAIQYNAIEITKDNFIVPPKFNELKKYPKGKKINWPC